MTAIAFAFIEINFTMASFRAPSLSAFFQVVTSPFTRLWTVPAAAHIVYLPLFVAIFAWEALAEYGKRPSLRWLKAPPVRGLAWAMMLLAVIMTTVDHSEEFIYFRF